MIEAFDDIFPEIEAGVFVAPNATVVGKVHLAESVSVWHGCVLRGDVGRIAIGPRTNVQDLSVVHVTGGRFDTTVGADVTVGHRVILHGCTIADRVLVGMGAVLMDGVEVGPDCIVGAGALVTPGTCVPAGSLLLGAPARVVRTLSPAERHDILDHARRYVALAAKYRR